MPVSNAGEQCTEAYEQHEDERVSDAGEVFDQQHPKPRDRTAERHAECSVLDFLAHDVAADEREEDAAEEKEGEDHDGERHREAAEVVLEHEGKPAGAALEIALKEARCLGGLEFQQDDYLKEEEGSEAHPCAFAGEKLEQFSAELAEEEHHAFSTFSR